VSLLTPAPALTAAVTAPTAAVPAPLAPVSLDYVSPSAIETFDLCPRKWGWSKLNRIPKVSSGAAQLGSDTHGQHERWLTVGTPYDRTTRAGMLAGATLHLLPPPRTGRVEHEFKIVVSGVTLGGKIDWVGLHEQGWPIVLDHKTTGDLRYAKRTKDELLGHPQAPIYGHWAMAEYRSDRAELRWNYVQTKGAANVLPSWHVVNRDEVQIALVAPLKTARRILQVVEQANESRARGVPFAAADLPPNYDACSAFGGCQFRSVCHVTPQQELKSTMSQMGILERLKQRAANNGAPPPSGQTTPASGGYAVGYGSQVNPPESAVPVAAVTPPAIAPGELTSSAAGPAEPVSVPPETVPAKRRPGRPKAPNATAPAEAPQVTAAGVLVGEVVPLTFEQELTLAAVRGLSSNPGLTATMTAESLAAYAKAMVSGVLGAS